MLRLLIAVLLIFGATLSYADDGGSSDPREHGDHHVLKVFDGQGKVVGSLASYGGNDGVFLTINGATTFVPIGRKNNNGQYSASEFVWGDVGFIPYASPNCSGTPIMVYYYGPRPSMAVREGVDVTLYIAKDAYSGPVQAVSVRQNPTLSQCDNTFSYLEYGFTPEATYPLTQHYPEPLRIGY